MEQLLQSFLRTADLVHGRYPLLVTNASSGVYRKHQCEVGSEIAQLLKALVVECHEDASARSSIRLGKRRARVDARPFGISNIMRDASSCAHPSIASGSSLYALVFIVRPSHSPFSSACLSCFRNSPSYTCEYGPWPISWSSPAILT